MAKKPGRPKLPKNKAKGVMISLRVLPDERKAFEELADKSGVSLSEWLRRSLLAVTGERKPQEANERETVAPAMHEVSLPVREAEPTR
ncbi:MAG TPA: hypothetical protein VEK08_23445 [Planctomycetota bacterium]|nr:hypothetical protein [Planctomycetota bacterium]